ncbi:MAG: hypothetical protein WA642_01520, partial [Steroidobacteraceae bacterium]
MLTLGVTRELPLGAAERELYIERLGKIDAENPHKFSFEHLYGNLNILDTKANSIILFTSILAAVYLGV